MDLYKTRTLINTWRVLEVLGAIGIKPDGLDLNFYGNIALIDGDGVRMLKPNNDSLYSVDMVSKDGTIVNMGKKAPIFLEELPFYKDITNATRLYITDDIFKDEWVLKQPEPTDTSLIYTSAYHPSYTLTLTHSRIGVYTVILKYNGTSVFNIEVGVIPNKVLGVVERLTRAEKELTKLGMDVELVKVDGELKYRVNKDLALIEPVGPLHGLRIKYNVGGNGPLVNVTVNNSQAYIENTLQTMLLELFIHADAVEFYVEETTKDHIVMKVVPRYGEMQAIPVIVKLKNHNNLWLPVADTGSVKSES